MTLFSTCWGWPARPAAWRLARSRWALPAGPGRPSWCCWPVTPPPTPAAAMLALTDAGFAASVCSKLEARDPERYGSAAAQLREKADRILQRQREQRRHEKNLREGKQRKPWATPPPSAPSHPPDGRKRSKAASAEARSPDRKGSGSQRRRAAESPRRLGGAPKPGPGGRRLSGKIPKN